MTNDQDVKVENSPKGKICLLPSLLTTVSLFSGFYSIISSINGDFLTSAVAILVAGVFDGLDGRVARLTGTTSKFGMEYDSLCDLVAFGVAPGLLAYLWVLQPYGRYGWLAAFLYVATTALRLARFNSQDATSLKNVFTGLPCPAAGGMIAASVMFCTFFEITGLMKDIVMLIAVYGLSYLMVSSISYQSFKKPETDKAKKFQVLVGMVLLIMVLATEPKVTLFLLAAAYVLSGPLAAGYHLVKGKKPVKEQEDVV
ncbi:MAG: CDP-diacylglycerol--serine O-phosphatidyltransferase [Desulfobulbaceae bacterium]|nr:CDP-diacylglycerol--serine O-phosphatidyltransferase [Desulfobulbaceae bacterium]HIJ78864.1 CDP-diacylglycerol--serine O-phosphatidyltransferase [Deltaproteobacteria bacterium]